MALCLTVSAQVKFNEVQTSNSKTQLDPDFYKYKDWIELYNTSSSSYDLSGCYLTDNKDKPRKWQIPSGYSIGGTSYLLVYCDGEDLAGKALHTSFKLSSSGGDVLFLYSASMLLLDSVSVGVVEADYTYGRLSDGTGDWAALSKPTPGKANVSTVVKGLAPKPVFSIQGGYYNKEQSVTLSSSLSGAVIRYTTDGSEPTSESEIYTGPITAKSYEATTQKYGHNRENKTGIQQYTYPSSLSYPSDRYNGTRTYGFVIKAKVFHDDYVPSNTEGNTYFININKRSLPVVAISTNFDNFFSADTGIYIQGTNGLDDSYVTANWRQDWERKVFVEYFDENGIRQFGVNAGATTMGAVSRNYDMKSLNIVMKKQYEDGLMNYPLFGDDGLTSYKSFVLRNAGNDWEQGSKIRDAAIQQVLRGEVDLETQDVNPVVMYLNGEYWGFINMRERYDESFFTTLHSDYAEDIDLLKYSGDSTYNFKVTKGDKLRLEELMTYLAANSMSVTDNYEYVKSHYIDVDNMINYYIAQFYCQNTDWPCNNMRLWRPRTENGKFRFPLYDTDFGYGLWGGEASTNPWDNFDKSSYKTKTSVSLLNYMLENEEFKAEFVQRFYAMMATVYEYDRFKTIAEELDDKVSSERSAMMDEWTCTVNGGDSWGYGVGGMKTWAKSRTGYMTDYVNTKFDSKGTTTLGISYTESQGQVYVCAIPVDNGYSATHQKNRAIRLTAVPADGYTFSAWKNGSTTVSTDPEYFATISSSTTYTAVFKSRSTEKNLYINEFLTSNSTDILSDALEHADWIEIYNGGSSAVDLAGLYLSDDSTNLELYQIPYGDASQTTADAEGFVLFWADNNSHDGPLHLPFKLDKASGVLYLSQKNASGTLTTLDEITYTKQNTDVSYGRYPDGSSAMTIFTTTTPGASNTITSDTYINGLVITEFMAKNGTTVLEETGTYADWFEVYNTTSSDIDMGGLFVTNSLSNPNMYMIPKGESDKTTVKAGEYYIFWCDKQTAINPNHVDFKLSAESGDIAIVQLRGSENYIIDQVSYTNQGEDVSYGRYPSVSSDFTYLLSPTPGSVNTNTGTVAALSGITINEILAHNTAIVTDETEAYSDYIEFYNSSTSAIDLGGLFVSDSAAYSLRCRISTDNSSLTTVQPGEWIVFWADGHPELGANHLDFSLSALGEDVLLSQITKTGISVLDQVTFGSQTENISYGRYPEEADNWEEMTPTYAAKNQSVNTSVALSAITSTVGTITPAVSSNVLNYVCMVPSGTTEAPSISATTVNSKASVTVTQAESLNDEVKIQVISANGYNSETYKVTFKIAPSSDATLESLVLAGGTLSPSFSSTTYSYTANLTTTYVPYLTAIATSSNAMVDVDYAATIDETTVITVTAEDGSQKQYEITYSATSSQNVVTEWSDDFTNGIDNVSAVNDLHAVSLETETTTSGTWPNQTTSIEYKLGVTLEQEGTESEYSYIEYHLPTGYILDGSSALNVSMDIVGVASGNTLNGVTVENEYFAFNVALVDVYGNVSDYITPSSAISSSTTGTTTLNFSTASYITKTAIVAVRMGLYGPSDTKKARSKAAYIDNLVIGPQTASGVSTVEKLSSDSELASLSVSSGYLSPDFSDDVKTYTVTLPAGTTTIPTVSALASDENATVEIAQAASLDGTAYVKVISQDLTSVDEFEVQFIQTPEVVTAYTDAIVAPAMQGWSENSSLYEMTYNAGEIAVVYSRTSSLSEAITYNLTEADYKILDLTTYPYASVKLKTTTSTSLFVELFDENGNVTASTVEPVRCAVSSEYTTCVFDFTDKFSSADNSSIYGMNLYFDKASSTTNSGTIMIDELRFGSDVDIYVNVAPTWSEIASRTIQQGDAFNNINLLNFVSDDHTETADLIIELPVASENLTATISSGILTVTPKSEEWLGTDKVIVRATDEDGAYSTVEISFTVEESKIALTNVAFSQTSVALEQNETLDISEYLTLTPADATIKSINWSVSDKTVCAIDNNGVLTNGLDYGTEDVVVTVTVTDKNGNTYTKVITAVLTGCPTKVSLVAASTDAIDLYYGESSSITYTVTPSSACIKSVVYTSSDESIVSVSSAGMITAGETKGTATITIAVNDGFSVKTATCDVNVSKDCSGDIVLALDKSTLAIVEGSSSVLKATITPQDECTENNVISWSSSNTSCAIVDANGTITALAAGSAEITAVTTGNGITSASCVVTVSSNCISETFDVVLNSEEEELYLSDELVLSASIATDNVCDESIEWSVSPSGVVTVVDGVVSPVAYGTAVITASSTIDPDSYAECTVHVIEKEVTSVTISGGSSTMYIQGTQTLTASVLPDDADDVSVTWSSSDESIATVSNKGVVTGVSDGVVKITAKAASGVSASYEITVKPIEVTDIILNISDDITLLIDEEQQVSVTFEPDNATDKTLQWRTSDVSVATVENGLIKAKAEGTAVIYITTSNKIVKTVTVNVESNVVAVTSVEVTPLEYTLHVGETYTLLATVLPDDASNKTVTWSSSDENIATVSSKGVVTAKGTGEATITVSSANEKVAYSTITVINQEIESVTFSESTISLGEGESLDLQNLLTINPSTLVTQSITWEVSDNTIASISEEGVLTNAVSYGSETVSVVVTVTDMYGTEKSATIDINLTGCINTIAALQVSPSSVSIEKSETSKISYTTTPEDACVESVTYISSNTTVATVSSTGLVKPVTSGETVITVTVFDGYQSYSENVTVTVLEDVIDVTAVSFSPSSYTKYIGDEFVLQPTITPSDATDKTLTWSSSNESVATVDNNGAVIAISEGTATITATSTNGISGSCMISVNAVAVTSVGLNETTIEMSVYDTQELIATVSPSNATNQAITWKSSNESVATVTENGVVEAISAGSCYITASSVNGKTKNCTVVVNDIEPTSIAVSTSSCTLDIDDTKEVSVVLQPDNVTDTDLKWTSSNETIATVSDGLIKAVSAGSATITVTTGNGLKKIIAVTVNELLASSVTLNTSDIKLQANEQQSLVATVYPEKTTDKTIEWSSSDPSVATVSSNGTVTAVSVGDAEITATTSNGMTAVCAVSVITYTVAVNSVTVQPSTLALSVGDISSATVSILPSNATNKSIAWSTDKSSVATVDQSGTITAVSVGTATITATAANGVSGSCIVTVNEIEVSSLSMSDVAMAVGESQTMSVTIMPENATNKTLTWSIANSAIATINATSGKITGVAAGTTTVTATASNGVTKTVNVTISATAIPVQYIKPVGAISYINIEDIIELDPLIIFTPENATNKSLKWEITKSTATYGDPVVASISDNKLTGVAAGTVVLTATALSSNESTSFNVIVNPIRAIGISMDETMELLLNDQKQLTVEISPSNVSSKTLSWESSDPSIVYVSSTGKVTAQGVGTAVITATTTDNSNLSTSCTVTVVDNPVTAIIPETTSLSLTVGDMNKTVSLTIQPADASSAAITWSSTNTSVVTVSDDGKISAIGNGTAYVTATASSGVSCQILCVVSSQNMAPVVIANIPVQDLAVGSSITIQLTDYFEDLDGDVLSFSIDDMGSNVSASVTSSGLATFSVKDQYGTGGEQLITIYAKDGTTSVQQQVVFNVTGTTTQGGDAIESVSIATLSVYPTPTTGPLTIAFETAVPQQYTIQIVSANGVKLFVERVFVESSYSRIYDLENVKKGVYFVIVSSSGGQKTTQIIVK